MKLNKYGIRGVANNLINNYLMNRKQFVSLNGTYSETACINCGVLQKRALRIISFSAYRAASLPLFQKYKILDVYKVYVYMIALFMFKYKKGECPVLFDSMFTDNYHYHSYETRQQMKLHVPIFSTNFCQRIIRYKGAVIYNYFADIVPQHLSIHAMKLHVKNYLLYNSLETT